MPAYMIVRAKITDEERYSRYRSAVMPLIEAYGGKHIRSGSAELLEGDQGGARIALLSSRLWMRSTRSGIRLPTYPPESYDAARPR
jgi:uncharacterized protein (DUF1330 family)